MFVWLRKTAPENRGALLLVIGISIFGFSDNLTLLIDIVKKIVNNLLSPNYTKNIF